MLAQKNKKGWLESTAEFIKWVVIIFVIRTFVFGLYQVPTGSMEPTLLVGERFFADKFSYLFKKPQRGDIISFNDPKFPYSQNKFMRMFQEYVWGPSNWTKRVVGLPGEVIDGRIEGGKPVIYINNVKIDEPYVNSYPLIHLYKEDPAILTKKIEQELLQEVLRGNLSMSMLNSTVQEYVKCYYSPRSYDPSKGFNDQPFYRIAPERIIYQDGKMILEQPYEPLPRLKYIRAYKEGNNSWNGTDEYHIELGPNQYWVMGDNRRGSQDCRFFGPLDGRLIHGKIVFRIWSIDSDHSWWIIDLLLHPIDFWKRVRFARCLQFVH